MLIIWEVPHPRSPQMSTPQQSLFARLAAKRLYWSLLLLWGIVCFFAGDRLAQDMKFRINDLSSVQGAGMVMRDVEGAYFHVNYLGEARQIYPDLSPEYNERCLDCVLVTGEKLAEISQFCAAGIESKLPAIQFEVPCRSWAIMDDGSKVVSVTLFLLPVLLWPLLRALFKVLAGVKPKVA